MTGNTHYYVHIGFCDRRLVNKVVGFDQLFRNPHSKPSNVQVDEGLFQEKIDFKGHNYLQFDPKVKKFPLG